MEKALFLFTGNEATFLYTIVLNTCEPNVISWQIANKENYMNDFGKHMLSLIEFMPTKFSMKQKKTFLVQVGVEKNGLGNIMT